MNSLSDILSQKADDLFPDKNFLPPTPPQTSHSTPTNLPSSPATSPPVSPPLSKEPETVSAATISHIKITIHRMKDELDALLRLLDGGKPISQLLSHTFSPPLHTGEQIIEGLFNGQKMIGPDGKEYVVPPNYASKSKLVEGDRMKLTITNHGSFIYKQIAQVGRKRLIGELLYDNATHEWSVRAEGKTYKILTASATFYKGKPGDQVIFLVPENGPCAWGAVENILPQ